MAVVDEIVETGGGGGGGGGAGGEQGQQGQQGQQLPRFVGGSAVGPSMVSVSTVGRDAVDSSVLAGGEGQGGLEGVAAEGGTGWSELALVVGKALLPVVVINLVGVRARLVLIDMW